VWFDLPAIEFVTHHAQREEDSVVIVQEAQPDTSRSACSTSDDGRYASRY
jgi:hypothetical protein